MIRSRPTQLTPPVGASAVADRWALRSPVLLASAAHGFANAISGALPALGSTARFLPSVVGVGANGSASSTTSAIGFEDYDFGGKTPITVIAFSDERPGANRSFLAQGTEVILRVSAAGTGVEFILNSFATNDRATAVADSRSSPGFFAAGTYGPSGRLRAYANTAMAEVTPTGTYANTADIFTAVYTQGLNQLFDKRLALLAIFRSEFSQQELRELSANPWQLFKPTERRIWVPAPAGGGSASQTVAFTLDGISAAVAQVVGRTQSLSASLDGVTFSASQVAGHSQTLAATLDGVSFAAVQSVGGANSQSLAVTLDSVQFAASQTLGHAQSATVALDGVTFAASQTLRHSQSLAAVLDDLTFSAAQSASSSVKSQSLAVTLDDLQLYATQEGPAVAQGNGFVLVDFEPKLWWKRKPKALDEQDAAEKIASVARQIERVAVKQVKAGRVVQPVVSKPAKAEILQAIAPQLQQMPGFDPVELYRAILERLIQQEQQRQAEQQAQQIAAQEIERIRLMELDEDETIILLMGA